MNTSAAAPNCWPACSRVVVFALAASSIACLLVDFYKLCPMSWFTAFIFLPALLILLGLGVFDRTRGDGHIWRAVWIGLLGGLLAAVAYDVFRLPFVFAKDWGIADIVPPMNLFKVFPRFGAMVLGQAIEQEHYSLATQIVGWLYHFSNGATFGVMYLALIGDARQRHWFWAVLFAVGLELAMLLTPYTSVFNIPLTARFVIVTVAAHAIFGVGLGWSVQGLTRKFVETSALTPALSPGRG
ncbi:MAG: hypothetical protein EPO07_20595 [Verrucomicrobia bacterium]|nr:MAG: hypothetical protein EPO07_20595 [Verrucomicrobiota bacterium]